MEIKKFVKSKFDAHFEPKSLVKLQMTKFDTCYQQEGESISDYVSKLRDIAQYCNFGAGMTSNSPGEYEPKNFVINHGRKICQ